MAWKNYDTFRKICIKKNNTLIYEGEIKLCALTNDKFTAMVTDLTNGGGIGGSIGSYVYRTDPQYNTWGEFEEILLRAGEWGTSTWINQQLQEVGDTLHFYGKETGPGYGVRFRRVADSGSMKQLVVGYYNNGTLFEDTTNPRAYGGTDSYGRARGLAWGVTVDLDANKAMVYLLLSVYHVPFQNYDSASVIFGMSLTEAQLSTYSATLFSAFANIRVDIPDPYVGGGGESAPGGGGGSYDDTSDTISIPTAPTLNLSVGKLLTAYSPNLTQLNDLADWLWQDFLTGSGISKLFTDVMGAVLSLHMLPFTPDTSTAITPTVGNFAVTDVTMPPLTNQFKDIDCGSLTISEYWGNYLDYNPYTKITLCLPYVGEVGLDPDEVMGQTVSVKYRVDCLTGSFVCFVSIPDKVLGQYSGNCALSVPLSSADYSGLHNALLNAAVTAASVVGSAAAGGAVAAADAAADKGLTLAANIDSMKVKVNHSGALGSSPGFIGVQIPYVIIHRPRQSVPDSYNTFKGYPANVNMQIGDLYGYTEISDIKLDGLPFTNEEVEELRSILSEGVYL